MDSRVVLHRRLRESVDIAGKTRECDPAKSCMELINVTKLCIEIINSYESE